MKLSTNGKAAVWGCSLSLAGSVLLGMPPPTQAVSLEKSYLPSQLDLALGLEAMTGDTNYSIGGNAVLADGTKTSELSPTSKLEWPLDVWLTRLDAGLTFSPAWRLNAAVKTNLGEPGGPITDRDWLTSSQTDIYSESDVSSFDALIIDCDLEWTFWQQGLLSLYAGAGYQHQHLEYSGTLAVQYSPSGLTGYNISSGGRTTANYDLTYSMPYLLLGSEYQLTPQLRLAGNFAVAPRLSVDDETVLLLRGRTGEGDMDGTAWMFDLSGIYYFNPWWHLKAGLHQTWIDVDGEQHQTQDGQAFGTIDMDGKSSQTSGYLTVGYSF